MSGFNKINLKVYFAVSTFLFSVLFSQAVISTSSWQGKWDSSVNPVENPTTYYYYELKSTSEGFNWKSINRDVPYGPNEQVRSGRADFVSKTQAIDYENKLTFDLGKNTSGTMMLTVRLQDQNSVSESFYFVPMFYKAGFDCNKASTAIEKAICTDKRIALADLEINKQYKKARKRLASAERKSLLITQRSWIKQRNGCRDAGEVDLSCLALSYAHRLATLQKMNAPVLGAGERVNSAYLLGLQKQKAIINSNIPLLLIIASEQNEWAAELMKHAATYTVARADDQTVLSVSYSYNSVCWPADCVINVVLNIIVDESGIIKVIRKQQSKNL